ncbi:MAG: hypothetical protein Kow00121_18890 [Elainellaceae cyanobacterium]
MYNLNSEDGVSAGLITWIIFIVVFFLLGIPAVFTIFLGFCGALAVGTIIAYWRAEEAEEGKKPSATEESPIRPTRGLVGQLPVPGWSRLSSSFKGKPPKRIGK